MILCCGEALIDMIPVGSAGGKAFQPHAGGAIFNTAIGLGRLGVPVGFLSGLSSDLFGQQLQNALEVSGVDASHAIRSDLPTTLAFVELHDGHATYTFYDENTAGRSLTPDVLPKVPVGVKALYFGGISLISEPCADFYAALAESAAAEHVVMLDPNIRRSFIRDEATYRARLARMIIAADIVKVSDEDLDWLVPGEAELLEKATALAQGKVVIITQGGAGAMALLGGGTVVDVPARRVEVVDTVGAGDTFNAGVLAELARQNLLEKRAIASISSENIGQALACGAAVAAITVSRAGANPPWASEMT